MRRKWSLAQTLAMFRQGLGKSGESEAKGGEKVLEEGAGLAALTRRERPSEVG